METPKHFKCYNRQKVGILLILSVGFGLFLQSSSSSSEETTCESSSNFNNSYCGFRKYIMKSYFEKYDSLLEPIFQNFIADELFNTCKLLPDNLNHLVRVSVPWRHLIGEGSHRHISTTIRFHMQSDSMSWLRAHFCKVIVIERLPTGVFADPFELQHLLKRGVFTDVAVFGDTNLELPSVLSNRSAVEIHINVAPTSLLGHKNELEISADLPLHVRYPVSELLKRTGRRSVITATIIK
ncbi:hypothetical protein OIU78_014072 [Salix suchowensis]|nr:hypothetical protein OIU78_014072 [Salix suchowensis]